MSGKDIASRIAEILEPEALEHGFELVAVEQAGGRSTPVVRVLLDREGGVDLESLTRANAWISELLDARDPIGSHYVLEVSSPGIDRPLTKLEHFSRFIGHDASIKTRPIENRTSWTGRIAAVEDGSIVIECESETCRIAFDDITKARLKATVDFKGRGTTKQ